MSPAPATKPQAFTQAASNGRWAPVRIGSRIKTSRTNLTQFAGASENLERFDACIQTFFLFRVLGALRLAGHETRL